MNRKKFMLAAVVVLTAPGKALAAATRQGQTIPYIPQNTRPYFKPGPELIKNANLLDPKIRTTVLKINQSGWVWTAESCQGHGWSNFQPMMRLVCRTENRDKMLGILLGCAQVGKGDPLYGYGATELTVSRHTPAPKGWFEIRVYARSRMGTMRDARAFWKRFAEKVNEDG